jgi:hypothetical protein
VALVVELVASGSRGGAHGQSGGSREEPAWQHLPMEMVVSSNSSGGMWFQTGSGDTVARRVTASGGVKRGVRTGAVDFG